MLRYQERHDQVHRDPIWDFIDDVFFHGQFASVNDIYYSVQEMLQQLPNGTFYSSDPNITKNVDLTKVVYAKGPTLDNRHRDSTTERTRYRKHTSDAELAAVQMLVHPDNSGMIKFKPLVVGGINMAMRQIHAFCPSLVTVENAEDFINTEQKDVRSLFAELVGLYIRQRRQGLGQTQQWQYSEEKLDLRIRALIERLKQIDHLGDSEFFDRLTSGSSHRAGSAGSSYGPEPRYHSPVQGPPYPVATSRSFSRLLARS